MGAHLSYHLRTGVLGGVARGRTIYCPTFQDASRIAAWEHEYDFRPGKYAQTDYGFAPPHAHKQRGEFSFRGAGQLGGKLKIADDVNVEICGRPGTVQPSSLANGDHGLHHVHVGSAIRIKENGRAFYIHGWPPCNLRRCIIVVHRWDVLLDALTREDRVSFWIEC